MKTIELAGRTRRQVEIGLWDTHEPLPSGFRDAWDSALRSSPHAHFAVDLEYLRWEASRDRHARALLIEGAGKPPSLATMSERITFSVGCVGCARYWA